MKILFVSVEVSPFAKVGGLADVAGSLPRALRELGHDVRIVMPSYRMIEKDPRWNLSKVVSDLEVRLNAEWTEPGYVMETNLEEVPVYLIGAHRWFDESVDSASVYRPGCEQYLYFSRAVLEAAKRLDWIPDVVHANDWHTGFIPVLMREGGDRTWDATAATFSIHNLAYQGEFGREILDLLDLPQSLFNHHQLETYGALNFLKAGCVYADVINTVSPRYAEEIQTPEFGCRLEGYMRFAHSHNRLRGILNGIETDVFNPETDKAIAAPFSAADPSGKAACREALLKRVGMTPIEGAPLAGVVSRLSNQKGMDLMLEAAASVCELPVQMIVQGLGDPWLAGKFRELENHFPNQVRFVEAFDETLAQNVYAGSDLFLMPSAFEPCGLGQMIALRYGTIPVVRETGGLANTIFEGENGFVFQDRTAEAYFQAVHRAAKAFAEKPQWNAMVRRALSGDYGWSKGAKEYEAMYLQALAARPQRIGMEPVLLR